MPLLSQAVLEIDLIPPLYPKKHIPKFESLFVPVDVPKATPHPRRQSLPAREGAEAAGSGELPRTNQTEFPGSCPAPLGEGSEPGGAGRAMPGAARDGGRSPGRAARHLPGSRGRWDGGQVAVTGGHGGVRAARPGKPHLRLLGHGKDAHLCPAGLSA